MDNAAFAVLGQFIRDLVDVLAPRGCAGCDMPDEVICPSCSRLFEELHTTVLDTGGKWWCFWCARYEGKARTAILGWKDHGDEECDDCFGDFLAHLALKVMPEIGATVMLRHNTGSLPAVAPEHDPTDLELPLLIVPAPSSSRSMRRRGRNHMLPVARRMASLLCAEGVDAQVSCSLRVHHVQGKSVETQGAAGRSRRIEGHVSLVPKKPCAGRDVIVVDDIVTTGATMRQCARVLELGGAHVVACLALAGSAAGR